MKTELHTVTIPVNDYLELIKSKNEASSIKEEAIKSAISDIKNFANAMYAAAQTGNMGHQMEEIYRRFIEKIENKL